MKQISRLPDAELEVMQALWAVPEYPARTSDLAARLDRDWKAPTLLKLLSRLEERGFVRGEKAGRVNLYTPLVDGIGGSVAVGEDQPPLGIVFPPYFFQRGVPVHRIESGGGVGIHIPWAGAEFPAQIHADEGG